MIKNTQRSLPQKVCKIALFMKNIIVFLLFTGLELFLFYKANAQGENLDKNCLP
jgi:hypothetical protein